MLRILLTMVVATTVASGQNVVKELRFQDSSDDVRFLAKQNHMLMQRLTDAEADIATLKKDYDGLKATVEVSSCSCTDKEITSTTDESEMKALDTALDKTFQMISIDMMSVGTMNRRNL